MLIYTYLKFFSEELDGADSSDDIMAGLRIADSKVSTAEDEKSEGGQSRISTSKSKSRAEGTREKASKTSNIEVPSEPETSASPETGAPPVGQEEQAASKKASKTSTAGKAEKGAKKEKEGKKSKTGVTPEKKISKAKKAK